MTLLEPVSNYFKTVDKMFSDNWANWTWFPGHSAKTSIPWTGEVGHTNAYTKDGQYILEVNVPGVEAKNVSLTHKNRLLQLGVTSEHKVEQGERAYVYQEYSRQAWSRSFRLPNNVDTDADPTAELKDGILSISFKLKEPTPLPPEQEPRKIAIKCLD